MWQWILLAIVLLLVLLCRTRVGAEAAFGPEGFRLDVRIGLLRLHIFPAKPSKRAKKESKKTETPKKPKKDAALKRKKTKFPSLGKEDFGDAFWTLLPALGRVLRRTRRGVRISPLRLSVTLGGREDPPAAAQLYGRLQSGIWTGMPLLEKLVDIREPYIHTGVDFNASGTAVEGEAGVTFRIGTLIAMGCGLAFPALGWLLRTRRRKKAQLSSMEEEQAKAA